MISAKRLYYPRRLQWVAVAWLTLVWVLLWGEVSWGNVLAGIGLGLAITLFLPLPKIDFRGRLRPLGILVLVTSFIYDVIHASVQISAMAFTPGKFPHGGILRIQLRSHSDLYLTMTSQITTLIPGSVVIEAHRATGVIYLHVFDLDMAGGVEGMRQAVLRTERRVLQALGSNAELAQCGYRSLGRTLWSNTPLGKRGNSASVAEQVRDEEQR